MTGPPRTRPGRRPVVEEVKGNFVHPFNDPFVIAGQGTVGLEIAEDCAARGVAPNIVVIPCSGGGLTAGITLAVTEKYPSAKIYTAEPEGFDDYARSLKSGKPERNARTYGSISDALMCPIRTASAGDHKQRLAGGLVASDRRPCAVGSPMTSCASWSSLAEPSGWLRFLQAVSISPASRW